MEKMTRLELPTDEWQKMMRHHKIIEDYKVQIKIFGEGPALALLHTELRKLQKSERSAN